MTVLGAVYLLKGKSFFTVSRPPHSRESSYWLRFQNQQLPLAEHGEPDWFSVCLAHHPVGFRTRMAILCACALANVRAEVFMMSDQSVCADVLCVCVWTDL